MRTTACLVFLILSVSSAFAQQSTTQPVGPAVETARAFLAHIEKGETDQALKLWDATVVNEKLKARVQKMSSKVSSFGGIQRVDVGTCEQRRIDAHRKRTGETIEVVPVEIICGNDALLLAVFSIRQVDGEPRILMLESLKEWGGTASLDDELPYQH